MPDYNTALNAGYGGPEIEGDLIVSALTGTVTFTNGSATVTGSGTAFTTEVRVGSSIKRSVDADTRYTIVASIASDTSLTLATVYAGTTGTDGSLRLVMPKSKIVTGATGVDGGLVGKWNPFPVIATFDPAHTGPFGDLISEVKQPLLQLDFVYGTNTQTGTTAASGTGATADTNGRRLRLQSGTSSSGTASFTTLRSARYRAGQGVDARFTAAFTTGVASSSQFAGMANVVSGTLTDGYGFGFNGTSYGIFYYNGTSLTFTARASWSVDPCDGTGASGFNLTPTNGNVYRITYPYLGYGNILFFVQDSASGRWVHCHTIVYANSVATVQLTNPTLSFFARSLNSGATTNQTMYVGSCAAFLVGQRYYTGPQFGASNSKTTITTETNILSIRNATTVNGVANRGIIRVRYLSFASDGGNGIGQFFAKKGVTLGGSPAFAAVSGTTADGGVTLTSAQSIASVDTAGTTITGGTI